MSVEKYFLCEMAILSVRCDPCDIFFEYALCIHKLHVRTYANNDLEDKHFIGNKNSFACTFYILCYEVN